MQKLNIILLPGLDGTGILFRPLIKVLPSFLNPVVVPYPVDKEFSYSQLLPLVLDSIPKDRPFVILGESFGGPLAIRIAATRPENFKALILSASFVECPYRIVPKWVTHLIYPFPFYAFPLFSRIKSLLSFNLNSELNSLFKEALKTVKPGVLSHRMKEIVKVNVTSEFSNIDSPILYIKGRHDWAVPSANFQQIKRIHPEVKHVQISASHMILQHKPKESAQAIKDFISTFNWKTHH